MLRVMGLAGWLAVVAGVPAVAQDAAAGAGAFKKDCTRCHSVDRAMKRLSKVSTESQVQQLELFLSGHHITNAKQQADIIAYLTKG